MAFVNVNRENTDLYYRYKMPSLMAKVEGKGNGVKTVIVNMTAIAKALQRPPSYPCKYFGCELGAQTQMDPKADRYIVNGAHEGPRLQELLDGFIRSFVLCEECENPETELTVQSSKNKIYQKCIACGHGRYIPPQHKLTTFIIKNPPNSSEDSNSNKKDKKGGKKSKGKKEKEPASPIDSQPPHSDDPDTITTHQNGAATGAKNGLDDDDDEDWSVDTSKAAVKARMEKLSDGANALTLNDDLEKTNTERLNMFFKFVEAIKKQGGVPAIAQNLVKIKSEAERLEVMETAAGIMAELLYTEALLSEVKQFRPLMLHFVHDNPKAQKTLLDAFEIIVGKVYPAALMSKAPLILKSFYDEDLLEEEPIIEWYNKVSKKRVEKERAREIREKVAPFVDWLKTAEEESEEDDEDNDDVEVVYKATTDEGKISVITESNSDAPDDGNGETANNDEDDDDDVNIDDI